MPLPSPRLHCLQLTHFNTVRKLPKSSSFGHEPNLQSRPKTWPLSAATASNSRLSLLLKAQARPHDGHLLDDLTITAQLRLAVLHNEDECCCYSPLRT